MLKQPDDRPGKPSLSAARLSHAEETAFCFYDIRAKRACSMQVSSTFRNSASQRGGGTKREP
ncbi:hypothetical protein H6F87_18355 [Cyanobacteria bacterium FACHB-502]|nr:hypothetical protein [Leptolyngbya sp. FACHB-711]MBD1851950.1 hypothetical protein [Cyanobacteria bacterium FACHB-502]MBD2027767.1 hypothetical protein [Leptolyngbya sp. FACHB-711]